jgi:hypothetical protein
MAAYSLQLECLSCSNRRIFLMHTEAGAQVLTQAEIPRLSKQATVTCGRCGSASLIRTWAEAIPDAVTPELQRARRRALPLVDAQQEASSASLCSNSQRQLSRVCIAVTDGTSTRERAPRGERT